MFFILLMYIATYLHQKNRKKFGRDENNTELAKYPI